MSSFFEGPRPLSPQGREEWGGPLNLLRHVSFGILNLTTLLSIYIGTHICRGLPPG
jgi:hypothetical protein